jgi:xanthine dehydrogenase YagS FAD-binding subunit
MSHPSDLAPALIVLGARVAIAGPAGRREVALEDFFLGARSVNETVLAPGEIITWVDVPARAAGSRSVFLKHRVRKTWDFALAEVAVAATPREGRLDDVRIALGGVAPFPYRATAAERALAGGSVSDAVIAEAAEAAVARARPLSMNGYKIDLTKALVRRALTALIA